MPWHKVPSSIGTKGCALASYVERGAIGDGINRLIFKVIPASLGTASPSPIIKTSSIESGAVITQRNGCRGVSGEMNQRIAKPTLNGCIAILGPGGASKQNPDTLTELL